MRDKNRTRSVSDSDDSDVFRTVTEGKKKKKDSINGSREKDKSDNVRDSTHESDESHNSDKGGSQDGGHFSGGDNRQDDNHSTGRHIRQNDSHRNSVSDNDSDSNNIQMINRTNDRHSRRRSCSSSSNDSCNLDSKSKEVNASFYLEEITSDDEIYTVQCPKDFDLESLKGTKINFNELGLVKDCNTNEILHTSVEKSSKKNVICALPSERTNSVLKTVPLAGHLIIKRIIEVPALVNPRKKKDAVKFPDDIKMRHPLLGDKWNDHINDSTAALKKYPLLDVKDGSRCELSYETNEKWQAQNETVNDHKDQNESIVESKPLANLHDSLLDSSKKRKRRDHDVDVSVIRDSSLESVKKRIKIDDNDNDDDDKSKKKTRRNHWDRHPSDHNDDSDKSNEHKKKKKRFELIN